MPTPFTHLQIAQQLLADMHLPGDLRCALLQNRPAYLLGSIAADGRVNSNMGREVTHFYHYDIPITKHPWVVMLETHTSLRQPKSAEHRAFIAGYVAHLAADEYWSLNMVRPYFVERDWGEVSKEMRFLALHLILIYADERDYERLHEWQKQDLARAEPANWLPFMDDETLRLWRDFIAGQISGDGQGSQTLQVFGARLRMSSEELGAYVDDSTMMQEHLWRYVPRQALDTLEPELYQYVRGQLINYWHGDD